MYIKLAMIVTATKTQPILHRQPTNLPTVIHLSSVLIRGTLQFSLVH